MTFHAFDKSSTPDDESLAQRVGVEAAAFAELYERYLRPVQSYVRARVPDEAAAEDVTAQVFLRSFRSAASFRGDGSYRSWLFQIARNTIASWKASRRNTEIPVDALDATSVADISLAPDVATDADLDVLETVAELPSAQREVVALRYWHELSIDEIADRTRRSTTAVRQLLHRARNRLRKKLTARELSTIAGAAGATGASALAYYSIKKRRHKKR